MELQDAAMYGEISKLVGSSSWTSCTTTSCIVTRWKQVQNTTRSHTSASYLDIHGLYEEFLECLAYSLAEWGHISDVIWWIANSDKIHCLKLYVHQDDCNGGSSLWNRSYSTAFFLKISSEKTFTNALWDQTRLLSILFYHLLKRSG